MTPFGARLRALRAARGVTLRQLAEALQISAAYLSALEHGKRGVPSTGLVHQVNEYFGLIWDDADELAHLARLSNPRVTVNTAGLTPQQTALANRLAQAIHRLEPETVDTNLVYSHLEPGQLTALELVNRLRGRGILVLDTGPYSIRAVTHLDVTAADVQMAIEAFAAEYRP